MVHTFITRFFYRAISECSVSLLNFYSFWSLQINPACETCEYGCLGIFFLEEKYVSFLLVRVVSHYERNYVVRALFFMKKQAKGQTIIQAQTQTTLLDCLLKRDSRWCISLPSNSLELQSSSQYCGQPWRFCSACLALTQCLGD